MNKLLDVIAKIIVLGVLGAIVIVLGVAFYQQPTVGIIFFVGFTGIMAFVWALFRVCKL